MNTIYGFINGIRTRPGASKNWTGRAVTATHNVFKDSNQKAEKVEYFTLALARPINQRRRALKLLKVMGYYQNWKTVLVAHSNGADVVLDALNREPFVVDHLHLFSPAVNKDCEKNGLSKLMKTGHVKKLTIYRAGKDKALWIAKSWFARKLGYGALGLDGPIKLDGKYTDIFRKDWGHSDWWKKENFNDTMHMVWSG